MKQYKNMSKTKDSGIHMSQLKTEHLSDNNSCKLREEYREQRRAGALKRRLALPFDSEYLKKKDPEYRGLKDLKEQKSRRNEKNIFFWKQRIQFKEESWVSSF